MAHGAAAALPIQVPVGVAGQVADRGPVRGGLVVEDQAAALQAIGDAGGQRAGIPLLTVLALIAQAHAVRAFLRRPDPVGKTGGTAVEVVLSIVEGQRIGLSLQRKPAAGNAVCIAAHNGADKFILSLVVLHAVKAQRHIDPAAVRRGHRQRRQGGAVGQHGAS